MNKETIIARVDRLKVGQSALGPGFSIKRVSARAYEVIAGGRAPRGFIIRRSIADTAVKIADYIERPHDVPRRSVFPQYGRFIGCILEAGGWFARVPLNTEEAVYLGPFKSDTAAARAYDEEVIGRCLELPLNFVIRRCLL